MGCGWPILMSVVRIGTSALVFMYRASTSDSAADDMTFLMIFARTRSGPLNNFRSLY